MPRVRKTFPVAALGLLLSAYAVYVEHKMEHKDPEEEFTALCDIEQIGASCSNVFRLPEGRMLSYFGIVPNGSVLDVPNAVLGFLYYFLWMSVLPVLDKRLTMVISSMAMASSVFLAVQLLILKELCVLCWSTHIINARLWWSAFSSLRTKEPADTSGGKKAKVKRV